MKRVAVNDVKHTMRVEYGATNVRIFLGPFKSIACVETYRGREAIKIARTHDAAVALLREYAEGLEKSAARVREWADEAAKLTF